MGSHHLTSEVAMPDEKTKPTEPVRYSLRNADTGVSVENMRLVPRDADILNKVFLKHKLPLLLDKQPT